MDAKEALRKGRINNIVLGIVLLTTVGLYFYGFINNIQAQKQKDLAELETEKRLSCEAHSISLMKQLQEKEQLLAQVRTEAELLKGQTSSKEKK